MKFFSLLTLCTTIILLNNCTSPSTQYRESPPSQATDSSFVVPPEPWITDRVSQAKTRLAQSPAGEIIEQSINAHGGLENWYAQGPLYFRFDYRPLNDGKTRDTYQIIDTWSAKAKHWLVADTTIQYGWNGEQAWKYPADAEIEINPRFWSLTPYYFVAVPFVFSDPGVQLADEGVTTFEDRTYHQIRATFEPGTGDAPDDYYVAYIDTATYQVGALRYVVSYEGFFPEGGHTPPKIMTYDGEQVVQGIHFADSFRTYMWVDNAAEELVTQIDLSEVKFKPESSPDTWAVPEEAAIQQGFKATYQ